MTKQRKERGQSKKNMDQYEAELVTDSSAEVVPTTPAPEPSPAPEPKKEEAEVTPEPPAPEPETQLFETPDGRKINAEQLQKEWKENFYPEFTRKSQRLAEYEKNPPSKQEINNPPKDDLPEWQKDDYVPKNYAEVIQLAKQEAIREMQNSVIQQQTERKEIEDRVTSELAELKKIDPTLDENVLFAHATKYGFSNLKSAFVNYSDNKKAMLEIEQRTLKNLNKREEAPIATNNNPKPSDTGEVDMNVPRNFSSATDYLDFIRGKK